MEDSVVDTHSDEVEYYIDLLFDMVIPKDDLRQVEGILDFVDILQRRFALLLHEIDPNEAAPVLLLIEPLVDGDHANFIIHKKNAPLLHEVTALPLLLRAPPSNLVCMDTQTEGPLHAQYG